MPVVHEQMQQRAGEEDEIGKRAEGVAPMLSQDVKSRDQREADHGDSGAGAPSGWRALRVHANHAVQVTASPSACRVGVRP